MIFSNDLKTKYPFATKFFETALSDESGRFAHAFMLCGSDVVSQYHMALSVAKHLNSSAMGNPNWVEQNAHPAVVTISPIDYTEKQQSIISVNQIRELRKFLSVTSPYHRVIIFTNAKEESCDLSFNPPKLATKDERDWTPFALNSKVFGNSPANALLKILEEPPSNVTYFFLTNNKEDMLATIVSRCQVLPVLSAGINKVDVSVLGDLLQDFPPRNEACAFEMAQKLIEFSKELNIENLLDLLQEDFKEKLLANSDDKMLSQYFIELLKRIENAKRQLKSFVSPQNVIENLFLELL